MMELKSAEIAAVPIPPHPHPHVLIFPYAAYGHVNSMLKLAELLCLADLHVTFVVIEHIFGALQLRSDVQSHFSRFSGFHFKIISDGLPGDLSSADRFVELFLTFRPTAKTILRELLISNRKTQKESITCVVADEILISFGLDVGEEIGVPVICFCTSSPSDLWAHLCVPKLIEAGELPIEGNDLEVPMVNVPGMEGFLRRCDLPSDLRVWDLEGVFQILVNEMQQTPRAQGLILNTFDELEEPVLAQIRSSCSKLHTIGPLHEHLKARLTLNEPIHENKLREDASSCIAWLDRQPLKSVIYVSFGSLAMVTKEQLMEFWHGLVNSGKRFLWVMRPDFVRDENGDIQILEELLEGTRKRGYMVDWAPQEEVLSHRATGVFLTHSGWNSTLESIAAGVPMLCWPSFGDQQINSRLVGEVWKLGLDMKETCHRITIEKMIRDLMDEKKEKFLQSASQMAKLARKAVSKGGSSYCNLDGLIRDIRLMSV